MSKLKIKIPRFKSVAMRIWSTFTIMILIIICSISILYLGAFRKINEKAKMQDLKVAHDILLKSNTYNEPARFDELSRLKGSDHFIYTINEDNSTHIKGGNKKKDDLPPLGKDILLHPPMFNDNVIKTWMTSFIDEDNMSEKQFKERYDGREFIFIISSIDNGDGGKSYLITYMPNMQDNALLYTVIAIGIVFIFLGFLTAKIVARRISKPLKELEDYTVRIAHRDWKEPIRIENEDEIGRLANSMNRMQKELKHAEEEEKMFLQSISHDLKTPVMVIMSHADAIIDGVYIESVEKTAEIIRDEAMSLEKKIKQILYLNTLDYVMENNNESEDINLRDLLLRRINRFEVVNSSIEWNLDIDEINIHGNRDKLQVAIENIMENGLRYAQDIIRVSLKKENSVAVLEIYNDGPNIPEKHIDRIFDNMYKDKTGNFGLGLAISKKIIDFHKGEIKAINRDRGVSFIVKFPV